LGSKTYTEQADFQNGILPTKQDIIENMMYLLRPDRAGKTGRSKDQAASILSYVLMEHWIFCNIYTVARKNVKSKILELYAVFMNKYQTRKDRKNQKYFESVEKFNDDCLKLFDIYCEDEITRKRLETFHGVKMTAIEVDFLEDQRSSRIMYCETFIDTKWTKTMERRRQDMQSIDRSRQTAALEKVRLEATAEISGSSEQSAEENRSEYEASDSEEVPSGRRKKRRKLNFGPSTSDEHDEMPAQYRHIRLGERKVRPQIYEAMDQLKSVNHMSETQAAAAVVTIGNKVFGRKWKLHHESESEIDRDTLPDKRNVKQAGRSLEALALHEIVKQMMDSDEKSVVTYADDGSKKQGAGSFSVQGVTINGIFRPLPTLPIASETRENLAELKIAVLNVLSAASGVNTKVLFEKLDFVLTDQTSHNLEVEKLVAERLETDHIPDHLFCNVHPTLMFNRIITNLWAEIENAPGKDKIYSKFLVPASNAHSSVTEQALDCITRLVNHDFDHKPWNRAVDFDIFIAPKKNLSVCLKDERFNRLTLTCAVVVHHLDDVTRFLQKFEQVTNQLACIVRCFLELDFMKVMYVQSRCL